MGTKILVVDDDRNICELLKLYLENEGYSVFVANDGQQAVEMFQAKSPELVLLDIMLPKMDGWQVCREIRKVSNAPIIMLTAKGETFDKVLGLELGADDYVTKPFDAKEGRRVLSSQKPVDVLLPLPYGTQITIPDLARVSKTLNIIIIS